MESDGFNLIFIISQPRSGSTLLQKLISNHPEVDTASEQWLLFHHLGLSTEGIINADFKYDVAQEATESYLKNSNLRLKYDELLSEFLQQVYWYSAGANTKYYIDKTPRYYEIMDIIIHLFPNAKIIILKRHPLAVLNSIIELWTAKRLKSLYLNRRDLLSAPFLLQNFLSKQRHNPNVCSVEYESLIAEPSKYLKRVFDFLQLEYSDSYLKYSVGKVGKTIGDRKIQNHSQVSMDSLNRWENLLDDSYWKPFISGYLDFLGKDFLTEYGGYKCSVEPRASNEFDFYKFICDNKLYSSFYQKTNLVKMLLYKHLKIKLF